MASLCFGTFAVTLQSALQEPNGNEAVVALLLEWATKLDGVKNRNGGIIVITPAFSSLLFTFKENIHKSIKGALALPQNKCLAISHFTTSVLPQIVPSLVDDLLSALEVLVRDDGTIPQTMRDSLLKEAHKGSLLNFLVETFLYAVQKQNRSDKKVREDMKASDALNPLTSDVAQLKSLLAKIPRPSLMAPPDEIDTGEMVYVTELLAAYADAEGLDGLHQDALNQLPKYRKNFYRQRKDYYAAETIRRSTRDAFRDSDPDQFEVLKTETYDGIIDVHAQDYVNGYERLNKVMIHAPLVPIDKCLLSSVPNWIGNSEKKGVCHILVNDGRIRWVTDDE